jgi:hypothetical protein
MTIKIDAEPAPSYPAATPRAAFVGHATAGSMRPLHSPNPIEA